MLQVNELDLSSVLPRMLHSTRAFDGVSGLFVEEAEYADDVAYYLVDEVGDRNHDRSRYYDDAQKPFDLSTDAQQNLRDERTSLRRRLARRARRADVYQQPEPARADAGA